MSRCVLISPLWRTNTEKSRICSFDYLIGQPGVLSRVCVHRYHFGTPETLHVQLWGTSSVMKELPSGRGTVSEESWSFTSDMNTLTVTLLLSGGEPLSPGHHMDLKNS
ncbi:hypothetical protein CRENBAI_021518 [Crenichthys baileyi]|uniref:Uncharacterized protein n=1 Tax=Crenichthys baileyi TaxID=28760 RepID=A0AAV9R2L5_9TELE